MLFFKFCCLAAWRQKQLFNIFPAVIRLTAKAVRVMLICCLLLIPVIQPHSAYGNAKRNYQVEAAFIYQFLNFTEWPSKAFHNNDNTITIGIVGPNPFDDFFKPVEGQPVGGRILVIRHFPINTSLVELKQCQLLFISQKLKHKIPDIISFLADYPVLTVSEPANFIYQGGMIALYMKKNKVKFAVNRTAAAKSGISFRARLLRVADKVLTENHD